MKKIQSLVLALCIGAIVSGCGKKETADSSGSAAPAKKLKLAFVSNNSAPFWTIARSGCDDAAKELGDVEVDFRIPATGSRFWTIWSRAAKTASRSARLTRPTRLIF
jgi:ABC-type sugar transport system substrate-binding protein